jgi:hypothetical protein
MPPYRGAGAAVIIIIVLLAIILLLSLCAGTSGKKADTREPYLRDRSGRVFALKVGPGVSHEDYIHDGTPHQNPAVLEEGRWFLFLFYYTVEVSYYPITINGRMLPDLEGIQARVDAGRRRGQDVDLVTLDTSIERQVIQRENGAQLERNVATGALAYKLNGKRR